jgi:hypothetical protein
MFDQLARAIRLEATLSILEGMDLPERSNVLHQAFGWFIGTEYEDVIPSFVRRKMTARRATRI